MIAIIKSTMKTPTPTPALNMPSTATHEVKFIETKMRGIDERIIDLFILVRFDY